MNASPAAHTAVLSGLSFTAPSSTTPARDAADAGGAASPAPGEFAQWLDQAQNQTHNQPNTQPQTQPHPPPHTPSAAETPGSPPAPTPSTPAGVAVAQPAKEGPVQARLARTFKPTPPHAPPHAPACPPLSASPRGLLPAGGVKHSANASAAASTDGDQGASDIATRSAAGLVSTAPDGAFNPFQAATLAALLAPLAQHISSAGAAASLPAGQDDSTGTGTGTANAAATPPPASTPLSADTVAVGAARAMTRQPSSAGSTPPTLSAASPAPAGLPVAARPQSTAPTTEAVAATMATTPSALTGALAALARGPSTPAAPDTAHATPATPQGPQNPASGVPLAAAPPLRPAGTSGATKAPGGGTERPAASPPMASAVAMATPSSVTATTAATAPTTQPALAATLAPAAEETETAGDRADGHANERAAQTSSTPAAPTVVPTPDAPQAAPAAPAPGIKQAVAYFGPPTAVVEAKARRADEPVADNRVAAFTSNPAVTSPVFQPATPAAPDAVYTAQAPFEGRLPSSPGSPAFAADLGMQLNLFARQGIGHARLQLHPQELGPLTVEIRLEGSNAQIYLAAQNQLTRQALELAVPDLAGALRESGLTLTGGGVSDEPRPPANNDNSSGSSSSNNSSKSGEPGQPSERQPGRQAHGRDGSAAAAAGAATALANLRNSASWAGRRSVVDLVA